MVPSGKVASATNVAEYTRWGGLGLASSCQGLGFVRVRVTVREVLILGLAVGLEPG